MKTVIAGVLVFVVVIGLTVLAAECRETERKISMPSTPTNRSAVNSEVFSITQAGTDTFYFGGSVWDAGDGEWEADIPAAAGWVNRKMWTWEPGGFGGTAHSGQSMDAWSSADATADPADHFHVQDLSTVGPCILYGDKSLFCGKTGSECFAQCYSDTAGTGYGNSWHQMVATDSATYINGDVINLSYDFAVDTESGFDLVNVVLQGYDSISGEWVDLTILASYSGVTNGSPLIAADTYLTGMGPLYWRIVFEFESDVGWSDEDGIHPTTCGACAFDNVAISGNRVNWSEDFEAVATGSLPPGWQKVITGCGDFAAEWPLAALTYPLTLDPCVAAVPNWCSIAGNVIALFDPSDPGYPHPLCQDNYVISPVIDLSAYPGLPRKHLVLERFGDLPLNDYIFMYWKVRYKPACASGGWSPWINDSFVYYTPGGPSCAQWTIELSSYVRASATKVQVALGVVNLCPVAPSGPCTFVCNETPYYDNVTFGVFGDPDIPYISMREYDYWQDQFAEDGSLNPSSTADTRTPHYDFTPPIFGDTLICYGADDDLETAFVFRMAKVGPLQPVTDPFFTTWFPMVTTGAWQSARMDTAENYGLVRPGIWMCTFHENDPVAVANGLAEGTEILPNNLFTPGTRIEYFVKANYLPTPTEVFTIPEDTTGGVYEEFEVLPMMKDDGAGSVEWPCLIVADHFGQRGNGWPSQGRNSDRIVRHMATLGYDYDMYNRLAPASNMRNGIARWDANPGQVGGPGTPDYNWGPGATLAQFVAYKHCILNAGDVYDYCVYQQDTDMLTAWLTGSSSPGYLRTLWISGDHVCRELARRVPWGPTFLTTVLCATHISWSYADVYTDYTYCLPMDGMVGNVACIPKDYFVRENGCRRNFDEIDVSGVAGCNGSAEVEYHAVHNATAEVAGVSNVIALGTPNYKTYTEGYDFCLIRDDDYLWPGSRECGPDNFMATWMQCVLSWFGCVTSECGPGTVVDVGEIGTTTPAFVTSLSHAFPNPMNPTATIRFTIGTPGRVMLRVFDVSGRAVRTLVDENRDVGEHTAIWDGRNDRGEKVASGVFFYKLEAPGYKSAKKIVILQ